MVLSVPTKKGEGFLPKIALFCPKPPFSIAVLPKMLRQPAWTRGRMEDRRYWAAPKERNFVALGAS
jgi:hypothetical protein